MKDHKFEESLNAVEKTACKSFKNVLTKFVGHRKARTMENIYFLALLLNFFPQNLGAVSNEYGEQFHQDISTMEKHYQVK